MYILHINNKLWDGCNWGGKKYCVLVGEFLFPNEAKITSFQSNYTEI